MHIKEFSGYILDLDGTVYRGDHALPGVAEAIAAMRSRGARVLFLSNKPIERPDAYAAKLTQLGIPTESADVLSSPAALASRLAEEAPGARLYLIAEEPVREAVVRRGLVPVDGPPADYVVASWDRQFHYEQLATALRCLRAGARLVATNPDRTCPVPGGELPDAGATIAALEACSGVACSWVAGKPSPRMLDAALEHLRLGVEDCLLVGDRLETDIAMGQAAGMATALVLSGVTRPEDLDGSAVRPSYVLSSLAALG